VNTYTLNDQTLPVIAGLTDGSFVVVWQSYDQDGPGTIGVYGQRYAASGTALGSEFRANNTTAYGQAYAAIAGLTDGSFVVVSCGQDVPNTIGVYGQRYSTLGSKLGNEFRVNTYTTGDQSTPAIAALIDGSFVVVWQSNIQDGSLNGIYGQRYAASGVPLGSEFRANTYTTYDQMFPAIAGLQDGSFVVIWWSLYQDGSGYGVYGQHYALGGAVLGSEFRVNTYTTGNQFYPAIMGLQDGSFVVVWTSNGQDGSDYDVYGQRYWAKLQIGNACDNNYTEEVNQPLSLQLAPLTYAIDLLNATLILQPPQSGNLTSSVNPINGTASYNPTLGRWDGTGDFADMDSLLRGLYFIPTFNYYQNVQINMTVTDDRGSSFTGNFILTGIRVDDAPFWVNNQLILNQGETRILTRNNIRVDDIDNHDSDIRITVNVLQNGRFEFTSRPGIATTSFTQQDIDANVVAFVHNGLTFAPSYAAIATDGELTTPISLATVDFNLRPNIVNNALVIHKPGDTSLLTNIQILAIDSNNLPYELTFTASDIKHGHFQLATKPSETIITFTQQDINDGQVQFIHDGSNNAPSYNLIVNDGRISSAPSEAIVTFNSNTNNKIPFTETTSFKSGISIGITVAGTLIGFAAWRYRHAQDGKRRRKQSIIANIIRTDLNLAGVHDFTSERGAQLLEAISSIINQLDKLEIDVIRMSQKEQENFAHKLAECLKPYVSHTPPKEILEGNLVTRPSRHLYYTKVKPLIKPNAGWLDTDEVKKSAGTIASQVKLNTVDEEVMTDTDGNNKSTLMQPLL
jgi:hypothetical protein